MTRGGRSRASLSAPPHPGSIPSLSPSLPSRIHLGYWVLNENIVLFQLTNVGG